MKKAYTLITITILLSTNVWAQTFFDKAYTNIFDMATGRQTADGGFIVAGTYDGGSDDMCMMKTDALGNTQWIKTYGNGTADETGGAAIQTSDGGYALAGSRGNGYAFLVKTNASGVTQWQFEYDLEWGNGFHDIYQMPDSSYILAFGATNTTYRPGICRIDKNGVLIWNVRFYNANVGSGAIHNVLPLSNGDFIVMGMISISSSSSYEFVVRFTAAGTVVWAKRYGSAGTLFDACQTSDGNIVLAGQYSSSAVSMKIDLNGNVLWRHLYSVSTLPHAHSVVENASGELLFLIKCADYAYPAIIVKTNAFGGIIVSYELTNFTYTPSQYFTKNSTLRPTSDGGFVLAEEHYLKKITGDLVSTCGIAAVTVTDAGSSVSSSNYTYTPLTGTSLFSNGFIEIPITTTVTSNCSSTILSVTTSQTNPVCNGQCTGTATASPAGGTPPYTYSWSPGGQTTPGVSSLCAGTYTITVTDAIGAVSTASVIITQPTPLTLSETHTDNLCNGDCNGTVVLTGGGGTPGYTYSGATTNLCAATYTFTVTDASGCTAQTTSTILQPTALTANASATTSSFCDGGCTGLNINASGGTSPFTYLWIPGNLTSASPNVCPNTTTTYTCTISDANGCTTTATVTVTVNPLPSVSFTQTPTLTCINWNPIMLSPAFPSGGTYSGPGVTGNQFDPAAAGQGTWNIIYTYTDVNGCADSVTQQITVDLCTGINQNVNEEEIVVYPNPTNGNITVSGATSNASVIIYNTLGEIMFVQKMSSDKMVIDLTSFSNGIYFLQIESGNDLVTKKIIKEN